MNIILRPSNGLVQVICFCGKAVVSPWKIWKPPHLILFPDKAKIDKPGVKGRTVEGCAAPSLPKRLRIGSLRDTHKNAVRILHIPCDTAIWSAQRAEV